jgi:hypothetical protein
MSTVNIAITYTDTGYGQAQVEIEGTPSTNYSNKFPIGGNFGQDFDLASDTYTISVSGTSGAAATLDVTGSVVDPVHDNCAPTQITMIDTFDVI